MTRDEARAKAASIALEAVRRHGPSALEQLAGYAPVEDWTAIREQLEGLERFLMTEAVGKDKRLTKALNRETGRQVRMPRLPRGGGR